jgi:uncharacterized metal-binding protein
MEKSSPQCVKCTVLRCGSREKEKKVPTFCPSEKYSDLAAETMEKYRLPENRAVIEGWLGLMGKILDPEKAKEKWSWTRIDEIMEYARIRGMTKLGIATCYSLTPESKLLSDILESNGFNVVSVSCLCGEIDPKDMGMPGHIFCNPILQAEVLDKEKTDLNIMMGLCVGHDILFLKYSKAETTPLVVKDRSTGHNPVAALYQSQGFFKDRFFKK